MSEHLLEHNRYPSSKVQTRVISKDASTRGQIFPSASFGPSSSALASHRNRYLPELATKYPYVLGMSYDS